MPGSTPHIVPGTATLYNAQSALRSCNESLVSLQRHVAVGFGTLDFVRIASRSAF